MERTGATTGAKPDRPSGVERRRRRRQRGFTLLELLIVVAIIGVLAAVMIPNLISALHRAKQKRTLADVRNIGTAWMSWLTDQVAGSSAGQQKTWWRAPDMDAITYAQVFGYLHPSTSFFYMSEVPEQDGWGNALRFAQRSSPGGDSVAIAALCRDGLLEVDFPADRPIEPFVSTDYDHDIVWADGYFVTWPSSTQ